MPLFVGTDIGGTFTDLVGFDSDSGRLSFSKTLTTGPNLVEGVMTCLADVGIPARTVGVLKHGTTQIINTLIERNGAKTALVTTEGFRDIIEIGRATRPLAFNLDYRRSPPLVAAPLRLELRERIAGDGTVLEPLRAEDVERIARQLQALGIEAVAVSLLNAYRNPVHEIEAARVLRARLPQVFVSAGTELSREWFEYERTCTAVANAYVGPRAATYLERLEQTLADQTFGGRAYIMASNGGVLSVSRAKEEPIGLVESGPVGGCIGAAAYARELGLKRLIAFDMGGTTAKCALVEEYRFDVQSTYYVGGYEYGFPIRTPVLDIAEVGTGGGSIAYVDASGALHVGPRSAGSEPGPVCFGRGGIEPTVTDANLVLDRIASGTFLRGTLQLDREAARRAVDERVGQPLGYAQGRSIDQIASGIISLANIQMASAIREITVERGRDVRSFELFAFGGGGPMHAVSLARELGIPRVIVPPEPGNFSALGMLFADARMDDTRTILVKLEDDAEIILHRHADEMKAGLSRALQRDVQARKVAFEYTVEMRFVGQRHSIRIELREQDSADAIRARFTEAYRRYYGLVDETAPLELVGIRVAGIAVTEKPDLGRLHQPAAETEPNARQYRDVYHSERGARLRTPIYARDGLRLGARVEGPAVIEEFGATTVMGPGDRLQVGRLGELIVGLGSAAGARAKE